MTPARKTLWLVWRAVAIARHTPPSRATSADQPLWPSRGLSPNHAPSTSKPTVDCIQESEQRQPRGSRCVDLHAPADWTILTAGGLSRLVGTAPVAAP